MRGSCSGAAQPTPSRSTLQAAIEVQARPSSWRPRPRVEGHAHAPGRVVEFQGERQQMRALSEFIARSHTVPCMCIAGIMCACSRNPGSVAAPTAVRHEGRRAAQRGWRRDRQRCGTRRHRRPPVTRHAATRDAAADAPSLLVMHGRDAAQLPPPRPKLVVVVVRPCCSIGTRCSQLGYQATSARRNRGSGRCQRSVMQGRPGGLFCINYCTIGTLCRLTGGSRRATSSNTALHQLPVTVDET